MKKFAGTLPEKIAQNEEWTIRGFIDVFKNIYTISSDTKIVSKILELHLFPHFLIGDKVGSGNTANIGSIQYIPDIINGNGVFAKAGEEYFNGYRANFGKMEITDNTGRRKKLSSFVEYLHYRNLPDTLNNPKPPKRKGKVYE